MNQKHIENMNLIRTIATKSAKELPEYYSEDFVNRPPLRYPGVAGIQDLATRYSLAFDNFSSQILAQFSGGEDGDIVVTVFNIKGKHVGPIDTPFGRVMPSGKPKDVEFHVTTITRISDGRVSERWGFV